MLRRYLLAALIGPLTLLDPSIGAAQPSPAEAQPRAQPQPQAQPAPQPQPGAWIAPGGVVLTPGVDILAQYSLRFFKDAAGRDTWFHDIEVPRGQASISARYKAARARFVLEAVRSASEGALLGVAGDSLIMRVREAYAGVVVEDALELRLGVVPTLTIQPIEEAWGARTVAPSAMEQAGLASPADLGGTIKYSIPRGFGFIAAGAYNGEGYTGRELNRGKNFELAAELHPLALVPRARPLSLIGSFVAGSTGTGRARANRITTAIVWKGGGDASLGSPRAPSTSFADRIRGGVALTYALGVDGDGARRSPLVDAFLRIEPVDRLIFAAAAASWDLDVDVKDDNATTITGAAGYRVVDPLEVFLAVDRTIAADRAAEALPGLYAWRLRAVSRVAF